MSEVNSQTCGVSSEAARPFSPTRIIETSPNGVVSGVFDWTGINWQIDVHVVDSVTAERLRRLRDYGWITLTLSATSLAEMAETSDEDKRERLLDAARNFPISRGSFVLDHSLLGMDFLATQADEERLRRVFNALWPKRDFEADARGDTRNGRAAFRDAKQVADAIRNSFDSVVTCDRELIVANGRSELEVQLMCVRNATQRSVEAVERALRLQAAGSPYYDGRVPPTWPTMEECRELLASPVPECSPRGCP